MGVPDTLPASWEICTGQEATIRTRHEQWTGSQLGKEHDKAITFSFFIKFCAEYITQDAKLEGWQAVIKFAKRNISNLKYAHDTTLITASEEEQSLLVNVKEESEKGDSAFKKLRSWHPVPSFHFMANK